jgi:hypothetical protein
MWELSRNLTAKKRERIVSIVFMVSWLWILLLFVYGALRWFYAPIRSEGGRFLDKKGNEFTEVVFHHFKAWETTLWGSFVGSAIAILLAHWILDVPLRWQPRRPTRSKKEAESGPEE